MDLKPLNIVIVEDHPVFAPKLEMLLNTVPGLEVVGRATDVGSAVQRIRTLQPDAAIVDVRLPDGTGFDVLADVKRTAPSVAVLMMTAYDDQEYAALSGKLGADFFFRKSGGLQEMLEVLKKLRDRKCSLGEGYHGENGH